MTSPEPDFGSSLLNTAVTELSRLPGIGRKTALRLALHLLRCDEAASVNLGEAIINLRRNIRYCRTCHNISQEDTCPICADPRRDPSMVCVVENVKEVMIIERTGCFHGRYHVLGGIISPMDGIGPEQLEIASLADRVEREGISEVILALGATMEGDTTGFYIYRLLSRRFPDLNISQLARGVAVGNELEYTDEITLGQSIDNRKPYVPS